MKKRVTTILFTIFLSSLFSYTIEDKKKELALAEHSSFSEEQKQHQHLQNLKASLEEQYLAAAKKLKENPSIQDFTEERKRVEKLKDEIKDIEHAWKASQQEDVQKDGEISGFWEMGETTISKLIIEYASTDALYVIPPDIGNQKLAMHCLLSLPKESWPQMIDLILTHNNVGVKEISPFIKQLYHLKEDFCNVETITSDRNYLALMDGTKRAIFVYTPPTEDIKASFYFLDKFKNVKNTFVYQVGPKIAIAGLVKDITRLVSLADNVWDQNEERISKIVTPHKISPEDGVKLLKSYFGGLTDYSRPTISMKGGNGLSAFALKGENSLVVIGSRQMVEKAETMILETEAQVNDPSDLTLYWHTCNHCKPVDLAETLAKVYQSLISCSITQKEAASPTPKIPSYPTHSAAGSFSHPMNPEAFKEKTEKSPPSDQKATKSDNFFPFPATGSLLMVVRKDTLGKIKDVIKKLDTPKKMVEIEVLLCERRVDNSSKSGINLLKLAGNASAKDFTGVTYNKDSKSTGILEFLFSSTKDTENSIPAIDLGYNFLLSQEDIIVTASPSTTTLNQVPTTLSITDQISIHNGANGKNVSSYQREDFGIKITLTPTVHEKDIEDPSSISYITLENNISFDTISSSNDERPSVHKRHIENTVRVPDGETIIIGGLRQTSSEKSNQKIPFLGEIPGFAKIFGSSVTTERNSEMFIFIKPKIIDDPATDLVKMREAKLKRRPGDTDTLLSKINESRRYSEEIRFQKSVNLLFGSGSNHEHRL